MKIVAAVFADFENDFLGRPSHVMTELAGKPILRRTLERLNRVPGLDARCIFVRPRDESPARQVLAQLEGVDILPIDDGRRVRRELLRSARKWNLWAWRGGVLGTTWFDEFVEPLCVARVLAHYKADACLCLYDHMPLLDVEIAGRMIAHQRQHAEAAAFVFTQAPPGLAGIILTQAAVAQLIEQDLPAGLLFSYRPEIPRSDPINQPPCCHIEPQVARTALRLTGDTRRSRELLSAALQELGENASAPAVCAFLRTCAPASEPLPVEVELELCTDHPLPDSQLRPPAAEIPSRSLSDLDAVSRLAAELAEYDDRLVVLGGHGDPLLYPHLAEICRRLRSAGICGIAIASPLVQITDAVIETVMANKVDLLEVHLDANSAATYRRVHGKDYFDQVVANIERIEQLRRQRLVAQPILIPRITRCQATIDELEAFYDRWIRSTGAATIVGYNDYCGKLPPDSLLRTCPPTRQPCRRLARRLMLHADGTVPRCGQDYEGRFPVGSWTRQSLREIWTGQALQTIRAAQAELNLEALPVCQNCSEWHRP